MANVDDPNGLTPVSGVGGSAGHRVREYKVAAADAKVIGMGDLLIMDDGFAEKTVAADAAWGGADNIIIGVAAQNVAATGVERTVLVYDDPDQVFEVQTDDGNTITTRAGFVGKSFGYLEGTISSVTGRSGAELDEDSAAAGSTTLIFHCIDVPPTPRNGSDVTAEFTRLWVKINPSVHFHAMENPESS